MSLGLALESYTQKNWKIYTKMDDFPDRYNLPKLNQHQPVCVISQEDAAKCSLGPEEINREGEELLPDLPS